MTDSWEALRAQRLAREAEQASANAIAERARQRALSIRCPTCGSLPQHPCNRRDGSVNGHPLKKPHRARYSESQFDGSSSAGGSNGTS